MRARALRCLQSIIASAWMKTRAHTRAGAHTHTHTHTHTQRHALQRLRAQVWHRHTRTHELFTAHAHTLFIFDQWYKGSLKSVLNNNSNSDSKERRWGLNKADFVSSLNQRLSCAVAHNPDGSDKRNFSGKGSESRKGFLNP